MNAKELVEKMSPELLSQLVQLEKEGKLKEVLSRAMENVKLRKEAVKNLTDMVRKDLSEPLKAIIKEQIGGNQRRQSS